MRRLWLIYFAVSAADLFLSINYLNPAMEANPIAAWMWAAFGYTGLVLFKTLNVLVVYVTCNLIYKQSPFAAKMVLCFGIFITTTVCLLFGGIYT
jgi:hypothetical protein